MRKIIKGNLTDSGCYSIRITEDNKDYYYNIIILESGDHTVLDPGKPCNISGPEEISWDDLSIKIRKNHYKNIHPNGISDDFQKNCFLYGEQKAREIKEAEEKKKEEERLFFEKLRSFSVDYYVAKEVYKAIGIFEKIEVIRKTWISSGEYLVDDKWYVKVENYKVTSVKEKSEVEKEKAEWGKRVREISKLAGTSYQLATVIGNFSDKDKAVEVLITIKRCLDSWDKETENSTYLRRQIRYTLMDILVSNDYKQLNFSKNFFKAAQKIIKSK